MANNNVNNKVKGIKICGGKFEQETAFNIFKGNGEPVTNNKDNKATEKIKKVVAAVLFGRNGSGKSTIARAFKKIAHNEDNDIISASLYDGNNNEILLSDEDKKNIYVLDQKFIDDNIKLAGDGLQTIVMLGEQVDLDKKIKEMEQQCEDIKAQLAKQQEMVSEYNDASNVKAPAHYERKIEEALKGDKNWAGRDRLINATSRLNTRVTSDTYKNFINLKPEKTRDELLIDFNEQYKVLQEARSGVRRIEATVPQAPKKVDEDAIIALLSRNIEKPILNKRDELLLEILNQRNESFLTDIRDTFSKDTQNYCPFCTRGISQEEKRDIIRGIENVLYKLVKEHQQELVAHKLIPLEINLQPFVEFKETHQECIGVCEKINRTIELYNECINSKYNNPYKPIVLQSLDLNNELDKLKEKLNILRQNVEEHNKKSVETTLLVDTLKRINNEIAHYDIKDVAIKLEQQKREKYANEMLEQEMQGALTAINIRLDELKAQKNNFKIAVDVINAGLRYIFFSKDRIQVEYSDGCYRVLVDGQTVEPNQISTGETNAIALCYFFSKIGENKAVKDVYAGKYIIVIDDPVTSFDAGNKVGILSYLKSCIQRFILGNLDTNILIMTHDMTTFSAIDTVYGEISKKVQHKYRSSNDVQVSYDKWLLENTELRNEQKYNSYTQLFKTVYDYVLKKDDDPTIPIGNIMRQLLEAYGTFQYKVGMKELSTKDSILASIPEGKRGHFENLMYRLVLDGGSHKENETKFNLDMDFQQMYSFEEKQRTAKEILCFLYWLNPEHVKAHLCDSKNEQENINIENCLEQWCKEI